MVFGEIKKMYCGFIDTSHIVIHFYFHANPRVANKARIRSILKGRNTIYFCTVQTHISTLFLLPCVNTFTSCAHEKILEDKHNIACDMA